MNITTDFLGALGAGGAGAAFVAMGANGLSMAGATIATGVWLRKKLKLTRKAKMEASFEEVSLIYQKLARRHFLVGVLSFMVAAGVTLDFGNELIDERMDIALGSVPIVLARSTGINRLKRWGLRVLRLNRDEIRAILAFERLVDRYLKSSVKKLEPILEKYADLGGWFEEPESIDVGMLRKATGSTAQELGLRGSVEEKSDLASEIVARQLAESDSLLLVAVGTNNLGVLEYEGGNWNAARQKFSSSLRIADGINAQIALRIGRNLQLAELELSERLISLSDG